MESITLPDCLENIGEVAFSGCENIKLYCNSGTKAEQYAKENGIEFELLHEEKTEEPEKPTEPEIQVKNTFNGCKGIVTYGNILCSAYVLLFLLYIFCN